MVSSSSSSSSSHLRELVGEFGMTLFNPLACVPPAGRRTRHDTDRIVWDMSESTAPAEQRPAAEDELRQDIDKAMATTVEAMPRRDSSSSSLSGDGTAETSLASGIETPPAVSCWEDDAITDIVLEPEDPEDLRECPRVLTNEMLRQLHTKGLPHSLQQCRWERCFAIGRDGDSFCHFVERTAAFGKTVVVVQTTAGHVLGGFASLPWKPSHLRQNAYFGTGQSFLFASHPAAAAAAFRQEDACASSSPSSSTSSSQQQQQQQPLHLFRWTGKNDFCQIANSQRLGMGGGADFGFLIQDNFSRGRTGPCKTFGNPALTPDDVFEIAALEVYGLRTFGESLSGLRLSSSSSLPSLSVGNPLLRL